jgi:hypothetical protein
VTSIWLDELKYDSVFCLIIYPFHFRTFCVVWEGILGIFCRSQRSLCTFFAIPCTQSKLFCQFVCLKLIAVHHTTLWNLVVTSCTTTFSFSVALRAKTSSFFKFVDHTQRRANVVRTFLEKRSARRRNLYLTTHNTHKRQTSMTPTGFEPTMPAS